MCLSKLIGDRCNFQTDIGGPVYYEDMKFYSVSDLNFLLNSGNITLSRALYNCLFNTLEEFSRSPDYINVCNCPIECQKTGFSYSISSSQYPTKLRAQSLFLKDNKSNFTDFDSYFSQLKEDFLFLRIYFEDSTETIISEDPKYKIADLVANLGGTIGLFTGFSFLSLI